MLPASVHVGWFVCTAVPDRAENNFRTVAIRPKLYQCVSTSEAITNAALHGGCARADLDCLHEHVVLNIRGDGVGVTYMRSALQGFGIKMMTYRAQALGGRLRLSSLSKVCAVEPTKIAPRG